MADICSFVIGYSSATGLQIKGLTKPAMAGPIVSLWDPMLVSVTNSHSCYDVSKGLSINRDEILLRFYNRYIMARRPPRTELHISHQLDGIKPQMPSYGRRI